MAGISPRVHDRLTHVRRVKFFAMFIYDPSANLTVTLIAGVIYGSAKPQAKILLSVIIAVVGIEGLFLYLNIRSLSKQMIDKTEEEAFNLSETIRLSIRNAMIKGRRDEYQRIIDDVAQRKGIAEVRIFNKLGEITVSSDKSKVGMVVDKQAEAVLDATVKTRPRSSSPRTASHGFMKRITKASWD